MTSATSVTEMSAMLDAYDVLVRACVDGSLSLMEFVAAYGDFPLSAAHEPLTPFRRRLAFHQDVAQLVSSVNAGPAVEAWVSDESAGMPTGGMNVGGFLAQAVIARLRHLVARYADLDAGRPAE